MSHRDLIDALGRGTAIADFINATAQPQKPLDREAVYKWAANGVPHRWRPVVAKMAKQKRVPLPDDFLSGAA